MRSEVPVDYKRSTTTSHVSGSDQTDCELSEMVFANAQLAVSLSLPQPEVPKFNADVTEFYTSLMTFDARIASPTDRLYYLRQHLEGDPKSLMVDVRTWTPRQGITGTRIHIKLQWLVLASSLSVATNITERQRRTAKTQLVSAEMFGAYGRHTKPYAKLASNHIEAADLYKMYKINGEITWE